MKLKRTYQVARPRETHTRAARCEEVGCGHHVGGWETVLPVDHDMLGWIRHASGLRFTETRAGDGVVRLAFPPGQQCFLGIAGRHAVPVDRPSLYVVRGGTKAQGGPGYRKVHQRAADWVEDMSEHLDGVRRDLG